MCNTYVKMIAKFKILRKNKVGGYSEIKRSNVNGCLSMGTFRFVFDDALILPFDFSSSCCSEKDGIFEWESGEGQFWRDNQLDDVFDESYIEVGIQRPDLTPEYLASATGIEEFYFNFESSDGVECDGGLYSDNADNEVAYKINLLEVAFYDEFGTEYPVSKLVIDNFNNGKQ